MRAGVCLSEWECLSVCVSVSLRPQLASLHVNVEYLWIVYNFCVFASLFACLICYCLFSRFSSSARVSVCVRSLYFLFSRLMEKRLEPFSSSISSFSHLSLSLTSSRVFMSNRMKKKKQNTHTADTFCAQHFEPNLMPPKISAPRKKANNTESRRKKPKLPNKRLLLLFTVVAAAAQPFVVFILNILILWAQYSKLSSTRVQGCCRRRCCCFWCSMEN